MLHVFELGFMFLVQWAVRKGFGLFSGTAHLCLLDWMDGWGISHGKYALTKGSSDYEVGILLFGSTR